MYETLLILHFLGLAAGVGTSMFVAGLAARAEKLPEDESALVMGSADIVSGYLAGASLLLLWGSGIAMITLAEGLAQAGGWYFIVKLALVAALSVLVGLIHRAGARMRRGDLDAETALARIKPMAAAVLLLGVTVVILAVAAFA